MKWSIKTQLAILSALSVAVGIAFATDRPPTVIGATSTGNSGAAPNGIAASATQLLFTQPYFGATPGVGGAQQIRGVFAEQLDTNSSTFMTGLPTNGVTAENGIAISSGIGSGFAAGDVFASAASATAGFDDIYKNGILFISNLPAAITSHQTGVDFDPVGSFGGALLVSADTTLFGYDASGTLLFSYGLPPAFSSYVLQGSDVAPVTYTSCPGCLFVTAMPSVNVNNGTTSGSGEIFTVVPGTPSGTALMPFVSTGPNIPEPESIHFVTQNSLSCTLGSGGYDYFASGYGTGTDLNNSMSTSGVILAWKPADLKPVVGQFLLQNEETTSTPGTIYSYDGTSFNVFSATNYQLEDTAIAQCLTPATGCPATQSFYHKASHWPKGSTIVDGVTYNWTSTLITMTIGGVTYTQDELLLIMPSGSLHTGGYVNTLSQFVSAVLNLAAGAKHTATIDGIILAINSNLAAVKFIDGTSLGSVPASVQAALNGFESALNNYNSATGLGCREAISQDESDSGNP